MLTLFIILTMIKSIIIMVMVIVIVIVISILFK